MDVNSGLLTHSSANTYSKVIINKSIVLSKIALVMKNPAGVGF
jgi:hypothetical protein